MDPWAAVISTALGIAALLLRQYLADKQKTEENSDGTNVQAARQALEKNDGSIDAVAADQHDRVQQALGGSGRRGNSDGQEKHH